MTITLPAESERFICEQVARGKYSSPADVIQAGLAMLLDQELIDQRPIEELRREIEIGVAETDRGELAPFDPVGTLAEVRRRKGGA
jgi:antitoxin ParD1/3/4